jgi:Cd2+/Zn2+-exporting ATPase
MAHNHLGIKEQELSHGSGCNCSSGHDHSHDHSKQTETGISLALLGAFVGAVLIINSVVAPFFYGADSVVADLSAMVGAILLGLPVIYHALRCMIAGHMHMDELVAIAIVAAFATGEYVEAGMVAFIMLLGELMESRTALGARAAIESLIKLTPKTASLLKGNEETEVQVADLKAGDIIRVRPGDNIAADGDVKTGISSINEATITGESLPVDKVPGMQVFAGTTNLTGALDIVVTKAGQDTTLGKVQKLIMAAEKTQVPIMRIIDSNIKWYVPTVLMLAAIAWFFTGEIERAISMLVISCPCALILATPTAMVASLSAAARLGILIKNVSILEIAGKITSVVFDKTGTLTTGSLFVTKIEPAEGVDPADMLTLAASAEQMSKHPAARAITKLAKEANVSLTMADGFTETLGKGVSAKIGSSMVLVGRESFLNENSIDTANVADPALQEDQGFSTLYIAKDSVCIGWVGMQDKSRPEAQQAVQELFEAGIKRVTMLTGDRKEVANRISAELGCTDFKAHCLPHDKLAVVEKLKEDGHIVAVIGDGVNDAPALAAGDLGIAMGAAGSDVAINSASIALMSDDLRRLPFLVHLSRKTRGVIIQNLFFGILFIVVGLAAAWAGWVNLILAAVLHFLGSLIVIFNSARLVRFGEHLESHENIEQI